MRLRPQQYVESFQHQEQGWSRSKTYTLVHAKGRNPDRILVNIDNEPAEELELNNYDRRFHITYPDSRSMNVEVFRIGCGPDTFLLTFRLMWDR